MTSVPGIAGRTFYRIEVSAMYDKRECLTSREAWELGVHTARFIGMSKRDMQLFDDILMVQVRDYAYQKMRRTRCWTYSPWICPISARRPPYRRIFCPS